MLHNIDQVFEEELLQVCEEKTADYTEKPIGDERVFSTKEDPPVVDHIKENEEAKGKVPALRIY